MKRSKTTLAPQGLNRLPSLLCFASSSAGIFKKEIPHDLINFNFCFPRSEPYLSHIRRW